MYISQWVLIRISKNTITSSYFPLNPSSVPLQCTSPAAILQHSFLLHPSLLDYISTRSTRKRSKRWTWQRLTPRLQKLLIRSPKNIFCIGCYCETPSNAWFVTSPLWTLLSIPSWRVIHWRLMLPFCQNIQESCQRSWVSYQYPSIFKRRHEACRRR